MNYESMPVNELCDEVSTRLCGLTGLHSNNYAADSFRLIGILRSWGYNVKITFAGAVVAYRGNDEFQSIMPDMVSVNLAIVYLMADDIEKGNQAEWMEDKS